MSVVEVAPLTRRVQGDREERARTLEAAALEIDMRGWCQHMLENPAGNVCAVGAYEHVGSNMTMFKTWGEMAAPFDLIHFNNAAGRTADEVKFVLRWRAEEIRDGR